MALPFLFSNFNQTTVQVAITSTSTAVTLAAGTGTLFPNPSANAQQFVIVFNDAATKTKYEVCYCTARSGDVLTIVRAQEGTQAQSWAVGDYVWCGPTSGQMSALVQLVQMFNASIAPSFAQTTITGSLTVSGSETVAGSTSSGGYTATNYDSGGFNFRATSGSYGAGWRNDGTNYYLVQTAAGSPTGSYSALRPFEVTLGSGAVTIDATGVGTSFGGVVSVAKGISAAGTITGQSVQSNGGPVVAVNNRLRASLGAKGSGDTQAAVLLGDFTTSLGTPGYEIFPSGLIMQWGVVTNPTPFIDAVLNFPVPFPNSVFSVIAQIGPGGSSNPSIGAPTAWAGAAPANLSQFTISAGAQGGGTVAAWWIALGY